MERLEKLKSKRSITRIAVTKLITKSENLLLSTVEETDFDTLNETLELLLDKEKLLLSLDSEIDDLMSDKNEYEKEVKSVLSDTLHIVTFLQETFFKMILNLNLNYRELLLSQ